MESRTNTLLQIILIIPKQILPDNCEKICSGSLRSGNWPGTTINHGDLFFPIIFLTLLRLLGLLDNKDQREGNNYLTACSGERNL